MAHLFLFAETRALWGDKFLADLRRRRYPMKTRNGISMFEPNIKEIKLLDITIPEDSLPTLLGDLAPFMGDSVFIKKRVGWMIKLARKVLGIRPIEGDYKQSDEVRKDWVNIAVIGWKKDIYSEELGMELI